MKKTLLIMAVLALMIVFAVLSPRVLFRQARVAHELDRIVNSNIRSESFWEDARIADYCGRWFGMYAKVELPLEEYDRLKQTFLLYAGSAYFETMNNVKLRYGYHSMILDDYEERFVASDVYGHWFTTGETHYALVKESSGDCYLYIVR